jgi:hypothetical protein
MYDLALMSIFINHSLYVSYSSLPNMEPDVTHGDVAAMEVVGEGVAEAREEGD